jgi:uncharacterized membrane protein
VAVLAAMGENDGARIGSTWTDLGANPTVQAVLGVLVLCILITAAIYLVARFRDYAAEDRPEPESLRANFKEMLRRGDITEAEYRMIQSKSNGDSIATVSNGAALRGGQDRDHDGASRKD